MINAHALTIAKRPLCFAAIGELCYCALLFDGLKSTPLARRGGWLFALSPSAVCLARGSPNRVWGLYSFWFKRTQKDDDSHFFVNCRDVSMRSFWMPLNWDKYEGIAKLHSGENSRSLRRFGFFANRLRPKGYVDLRKTKSALRSSNFRPEASFAIPSYE